MANAFVVLTVPTAIGVGPDADVSGLDADKSLVVETYGSTGNLVLEGSCDGGATFAPVAVLSLVQDSAAVTFHAVLQRARVRRLSGSGVMAAALGAQATPTNLFGTLVVPNSGQGPLFDSSLMGVDKTIVVGGDYVGIVGVEGSNDGTNFDPIATFNSSGPGSVSILGVYTKLRAIKQGADGTAPSLSVGAGLGGGGGGGGAQGFQGNQGFQGTAGSGAQGSQGNQGGSGSQGNQGGSGAQGNQGATGSGSQGFQGTPGAQGNQGTAGSGSQGAQGAQGSQGTGGAGSQGFQGFQGSPGSQGSQGAQGAGNQGNQGNQGAQGPGGGFQGAQGEQGFQGNQGGAGAQGNQGATGSGAQGAQGAQGEQGFQGIPGTGAQGAQGAQGEQGTQGPGGGAQGFQGFQGNQGQQGFQGATGSGAQGAQGQQGTQGPQGEQGFQGVPGSGAQGAQGFQGGGGSGSQGAQGFQGNQGATGSGAQGATGAQGNQGNQGFQGDSGAGSQGFQGFQGTQGNQGFQGTSGAGTGTINLTGAERDFIGANSDGTVEVVLLEWYVDFSTVVGVNLTPVVTLVANNSVAADDVAASGNLRIGGTTPFGAFGAIAASWTYAAAGNTLINQTGAAFATPGAPCFVQITQVAGTRLDLAVVTSAVRAVLVQLNGL